MLFFVNKNMLSKYATKYSQPQTLILLLSETTYQKNPSWFLTAMQYCSMKRIYNYKCKGKQTVHVYRLY